MPCRVKYQFTEEGDKVRVSKRSGRVIPKAPQVYQRKDFKSRSGYQGNHRHGYLTNMWHLYVHVEHSVYV